MAIPFFLLRIDKAYRVHPPSIVAYQVSILEPENQAMSKRLFDLSAHIHIQVID